MMFDNLEHEVLYEFFKTENTTDEIKSDSIVSCVDSFANAIKEIKMLSENTDSFFISYPKQKWYGFIILFIKRFIRKCLRWYINPIIERQNRYNTEIINILKTMQKNIEYMKKEIADLNQHKR